DLYVTGVQTCALPIFARNRRGGLDLLGESFAVAEHAGHLATEGDDACAGQRREIDDGGGLLGAGGDQAIRQDQPPLGVSVEHLRSEERRVGKEWKYGG